MASLESDSCEVSQIACQMSAAAAHFTWSVACYGFIFLLLSFHNKSLRGAPVKTLRSHWRPLIMNYSSSHIDSAARLKATTVRPPCFSLKVHLSCSSASVGKFSKSLFFIATALFTVFALTGGKCPTAGTADALFFLLVRGRHAVMTDHNGAKHVIYVTRTLAVMSPLSLVRTWPSSWQNIREHIHRQLLLTAGTVTTSCPNNLAVWCSSGNPG